MILVLVILGLILFGLGWTFRWFVKNRVRITMHRTPTGREMLFISMAIRVLKILLRLLLRR